MLWDPKNTWTSNIFNIKILTEIERKAEQNGQSRQVLSGLKSFRNGRTAWNAWEKGHTTWGTTNLDPNQRWLMPPFSDLDRTQFLTAVQVWPNSNLRDKELQQRVMANIDICMCEGKRIGTLFYIYTEVCKLSLVVLLLISSTAYILLLKWSHSVFFSVKLQS